MNKLIFLLNMKKSNLLRMKDLLDCCGSAKDLQDTVDTNNLVNWNIAKFYPDHIFDESIPERIESEPDNSNFVSFQSKGSVEEKQSVLLLSSQEEFLKPPVIQQVEEPILLSLIEPVIVQTVENFYTNYIEPETEQDTNYSNY